MNSFIRKEGLTWLALIVLTLIGFFNSEAGGAWVAYIVLAVALLKFFLIFLVFMEMKQANRAWRLAMAFFMLLLVGAIAFSL